MAVVIPCICTGRLYAWADVIALKCYGRCLKPLRMLYPLFSMVTDVIAMVLLWQMLKTTSCCNIYMADVIANVAGGIATEGWVL